jgi:hypothetical protein
MGICPECGHMTRSALRKPGLMTAVCTLVSSVVTALPCGCMTGGCQDKSALIADDHQLDEYLSETPPAIAVERLGPSSTERLRRLIEPEYSRVLTG